MCLNFLNSFCQFSGVNVPGMRLFKATFFNKSITECINVLMHINVTTKFEKRRVFFRNNLVNCNY